MQQLSGLDAAFVHQDTARTPMHMTVALIYDTGENHEFAIGEEQLVQLVSDRLAQFPLFNRKLKPVLFGIDTPYWIDVSKPRFVDHVSESSLIHGDDWNTLGAKLAALHGAQMDLKRPLWEMHLVHDVNDMPQLPPCCQVLALKIHHSALDGVSMAAIVSALHEPPKKDNVYQREASEEPSLVDIWTRANFNDFGRQLKLVETARKVLPSIFKTESGDSALGPIHSTAAHFNAAIHQYRHTGAAVFSKAKFLAIKRGIKHVTLNDIALGIVSGALSEYLRHHHALPTDSLAAGVPINIRQHSENLQGSNKIATMAVGLATQLSDPVERVRLIHRYAVKGKKQIKQLGTESVLNLSDSVNPSILSGGIKALNWVSQVAKIGTPFHTMVSNVPGPQEPLSLEKAELLIPIGFGPIRDNSGLFHVVCNSHHLISLSFNACTILLPDPDFYQQCLNNAFTELHEAAVG